MMSTIANDSTAMIIEDPAIEVFRIRARKPFYDRDIKDISIVLFQLGVRVSLKGYKYLQSAVKLALADPSSLDLITKCMYREIAKKYGSNSGCVERAIRNAINHIDPENECKKEIFSSDKDHYTNKEFIAGIAEYIRLQRAS